METELRTTLLGIAERFAVADNCGLTTVARRCRSQDSGFFKRLGDPRKSFTVRTFDEVMAWFDENWPAEKERPYELLKWIAESKPHFVREVA